jgi:hypothetical protein
MLVGRSLRGWATVLCHLTAQWHVSAGVMYAHLVGDAADSPIVDDRGSNGRRRTSRCGRPSGAPRRYRTSWNPFFPCQMRRIEEGMGGGLR